MERQANNGILLFLLAALMLRVVAGAPCCMVPLDDGAGVQAGSHAQHAQHHSNDQSDDPHSGHGEDATAKPCCSACGPTLPPEPVALAKQTISQRGAEPQAIRSLATRPPYPAYDATGPPLLI